jgi:nitrate reductase gamma subunit
MKVAETKLWWLGTVFFHVTSGSCVAILFVISGHHFVLLETQRRALPNQDDCHHALELIGHSHCVLACFGPQLLAALL